MLTIWRISWRSITQNKKRFILSLLGMIMGVAFVTSMLVADRTTNDVFRYYEQMYVGNADYWILRDGASFSENDVLPLLDGPDVQETLLVLDQQAFFSLESDYDRRQLSVRITGVSDQASSLLTIPLVAGEADNEGLIIPEPVAELLGKEVGDTIRFEGLGEAKISGISAYTQLLASPGSWEKAASSSFRVMAPLEMLRDWTGSEDDLSYIRFQTNDNGAALFSSLQKELESEPVIVQPVVADDRQSNDIGGLYTFFYLVAGLSMAISGFIVFNLIYTSVTERKKEFAIMKSFGYLQSSVSKLILTEVLYLSVLAVLIGVPAGVLLGDLFMQTLLGVFAFDMVYTLNWQIPALISASIGLVFPVLFSLFPIYAAGKTPILLTLKKESGGGNRTKAALLRYAIGAGLMLFLLVDHMLAYLAVLVGVVLLFPLLVQGFVLLLKPLFSGGLGFSGKLAADSLLKKLNRNANTAAILATGIAMILLLSSVIESAPASYEDDIRATYGGDIRVTSVTPWTEEDRQSLLGYTDVTSAALLGEATPLTWETRGGAERQFSLYGTEENGPRLFETEQGTDVYTAMQSERAIVLGERAFDEWGGEIGETMSLNTPSGTQDWVVADVVKTAQYSGYVAFADRQRVKEEMGWSNEFDLLLTLEDGADRDRIQEQLWADYGGRLSKVETVEDKIQSTTSAFYGVNELISAMLVLVIGLASVGTANTLLMNTLERVNEIGTMRAVGFTKRQVQTMIMGEGLLIGVSGVAGGILSSTLLLFFISRSEQLGAFISFRLPLIHLLIVLFAGVTLSLIAAWISSRTASKMEILTSLKES